MQLPPCEEDASRVFDRWWWWLEYLPRAWRTMLLLEVRSVRAQLAAGCCFFLDQSSCLVHEKPAADSSAP